MLKSLAISFGIAFIGINAFLITLKLELNSLAGQVYRLNQTVDNIDAEVLRKNSDISRINANAMKSLEKSYETEVSQAKLILSRTYKQMEEKDMVFDGINEQGDITIYIVGDPMSTEYGGGTYNINTAAHIIYR